MAFFCADDHFDPELTGQEPSVYTPDFSRNVPRRNWLISPVKSENPHQRTRKDHATETAEDYVEAIAEILAEQDVCRSSDLARRFAVSHVTVHRIVSRLQDDGLLTTEPYQPIRLTAKGRRMAKRSRERHELVYRFLLAIGVDPETAAKDTEGIEHHVSPKTLEQFKRIIERLS